jgi:hypothetical protein
LDDSFLNGTDNSEQNIETAGKKVFALPCGFCPYVTQFGKVNVRFSLLLVFVMMLGWICFNQISSCLLPFLAQTPITVG